MINLKRRGLAASQEIYSVVLSFYDTDKNAYSVTWHTAKKDRASMKIRRADSQEETVIECVSRKGHGDYVNRAVVYNLSYDTKYEYRIFSGREEKLHASFTTPQKDQKDITFMHISDTQDEEHNGEVWAKLAHQAFSSPDAPEFVLHTGDVVQYGNEEKLWKKMLASVENYASSVPMMLTAGNHSYWKAYSRGVKNIEYNHTTVNLPKQNTKNGIYYSFDYGDVHFTVLSSGDSKIFGTGKKQRKWLEKDLESTQKKWKIVAIHNPLYSSGKYGSSPATDSVARAQRKTLGKIFSKYGVDLVLQGHDHNFSLTKPIDAESVPVECEIREAENGGQKTVCFVNPTQPIYLMSGAGGNQNREVVPTYNPKWFFYTSSVDDGTAGYSIIKAESNKLSTVYREYNYIEDKFGFTFSWAIIKE